MAGSITELIETFVSFFTELGGFAVGRGGRNAVRAAASRVGWASSGGGGRRAGGHRLSGHRMGSGFGRSYSSWGKYDPKREYQAITGSSYRRAMYSGSGAGRAPMALRSQAGQPLARGNGLNYNYRAKNFQQQKLGGQSTGLKSQVGFRSVKF